jgi:hypothetical protein
LGYWAVLFLKMPFEVVWMVFFLCCVCTHTEFVVLARAQLWRSPIATRTTGPAGKHLRYAFRGKFRNSRFALRHLNFLSPAFAFLEPEVRIGGDRATPQPVACSALGVSPCGSHSKLDRCSALIFCQRPRQWSAATFGVPMTNNKGPLGTLGMGIPCGAV